MERFFYLCDNMLGEEEAALLRRLAAQEGYEFGQEKSAVLKAWHDFEISLRNELVRIRAARRKVDPAKYIRPGDHQDPMITHIAALASRSLSLLEGEKLQDLERWKLFEEAAAGHIFDFEALAAYCLKLRLLERWNRVEEAKKEELLESCVNAPAV
jgi:hypothetical protein